MKQVIYMNNHPRYHWVKGHSAFLLIVFQLITFTAVSQNLAFALEFNDNIRPLYESKSKSSSLTFSGYPDFNIDSEFLTFTNQGSLGLDRDDFFRLNSLDPEVDPKNSKYGYTIMAKIKTDAGIPANYEQQIFWVRDNSGRVIYGFKKSGNKLIFQRYAKDFSNQKIIGTWDFELWNPAQFTSNVTEYIIIISVIETMFRVKIYPKNYVVDPEKNKLATTCGCDLVYYGGQKLSQVEIKTQIKDIGFGAPNQDSRYSNIGAIAAIDYFRIYDKAILGVVDPNDPKKISNAFDEMDKFYTANKGELPAARIANKNKNEEIVDDNETDSMGLKIFPNPVNGGKELFAQFNLRQADKVTLQIFGLSGQLIRSENFNVPSGTTKLPINIREISSGMYIIKTQGSQISESKKIIIEQ